MADIRGGANVACDTAAEKFACNVFGSTHQVWSQSVSGYPLPTPHVFTARNQSGCGPAQAAMGPLYCSADAAVCLDYAYFGGIAQRFGRRTRHVTGQGIGQ